MEDFKFKPLQIDDHIEKIGITVKPPIQHNVEQQGLHDFGIKLTQRWPSLFESLVQSTTDFRIIKKFIFPAKGQAELATLNVTQKSLVFVLPKRIAVLDEDIYLGISDSDNMVIPAIHLFRSFFQNKSIIRVGQINEYVFDVGQIESLPFLAERFTHLSVPPDGELQLRINLRTEHFNRTIIMTPVTKTHISNRQKIAGYGINIKVDFNNRVLQQNMDDDSIRNVIYESTKFNGEELYDFLNSTIEGETE